MELAVLVGGRPGRRTVRDWLADLALFGVGLLFWGWGLYDLMVAPDPAYLALLTDWMIAIDPWLGLAACLALWWRRRFPLQLAVLMVPTLSLAGTSLGAVLVSILTVAIHRRWWQASLITAIQLGQSVLFVVSYQPAGVTVLQHLVTLVLLMTVPLVSGLVVRFRRELIVSLHQAAERQQEEHDRRLAEARRAERARIAREMHDVLAHRISLLSVHAGALAYRISQAEQRQAGLLTGEEITGAVEVIRENAHQALSELSEVLAVLRADQLGEQAASARDLDRTPLPGLADLERLVEEARDVDQQISFTLAAQLAVEPPRQPVQHTLYRVVQEGLTNARKHAAGQPVSVRVSGGPAEGVRVEVRNPVPVRRAGAIPGGGVGLAGLAERVAVHGGELSGAVEGDEFRLSVRIPWQP